tara:strand:+ start:1287 stop:1790 length:504 start_codon:yes stop_codon:yes gene_type:complete
MNTPIEVGNGTLTMCGLNDFMETVEGIDNPAVVTLCDKPHRQWHGETYCHYLSYKKFTPLANWTAAAQKVMKLLDEGRDVVLHCIHGRDRTGTIAYVVMRHLEEIKHSGFEELGKLFNGMTYEEYEMLPHSKTLTAMYEARPSMKRQWQTLMNERLSFHLQLLKSLD